MILLASLGLFPLFCFLDLDLGCVLTSEFSYKDTQRPSSKAYTDFYARQISLHV